MWLTTRFDRTPLVPTGVTCQLVAAMHRDCSERFTEYSSTVRDLMLAGF